MAIRRRLDARAFPEAVAHAARFFPHDRACDIVRRTALRLLEQWAELPPSQHTVRYFLQMAHHDVMDARRLDGRRDGMYVNLDDPETVSRSCPEPEERSPKGGRSDRGKCWTAAEFRGAVRPGPAVSDGAGYTA